MQALCAIAMRHPATSEGVACPGTPMERRTIKAANKAFLFVGATDAMVKLGDSLREAKRRASAEPARFVVGKTAWVKLLFDDRRPVPADLARRWIAESYALVTGGACAIEPPANKRAARRSR